MLSCYQSQQPQERMSPCGGFTLLGSWNPPQPLSQSPSLEEEGKKKVCLEGKQNKQTNKKNSLGGTTTTTGRLPMALLYLGSHWEYPRSSCLNCTSWQETDLELSRNRKVHSFHNSSCSLLVALCLNIGCHMGTRWAPLRPALPTPHSARNNKKNNAQRSTSLQKYK